MPKFSVVIAVYNKEQYVAKTLQSVLKQTFQDFEIIIVNDGSIDGSEAIINTFTDQRIHYYLQPNQGAAAARNAAISKATGNYIALIDADDLWESSYLEKMSTLIEQHPLQAVFACACLKETRGKTILSHYSIASLQPDAVHIVNYFEASTIDTVLTSSSTILKKDVFQEVGGYNPALKSGEDTDFWIRLGIKYPVVFLNTPLATYVYHPQSLSNSSLPFDQMLQLDIYKEEVGNIKGLKKFLDLNRYSLALQAKRRGDRNAFTKYRDGLDSNHLNSKQKILLSLPPWILKGVYSFKNTIEKLGITVSAFR